LLPAAFTEYGLPLEIYVDFHSLFFTHDPKRSPNWQAFTSTHHLPLRPPPQAKGKVERAHFFWQERLPAYFASEHISDLDKPILRSRPCASIATSTKSTANSK